LPVDELLLDGRGRRVPRLLDALVGLLLGQPPQVEDALPFVWPLRATTWCHLCPPRSAV
jgi:hypothetical protein